MLVQLNIAPTPNSEVVVYKDIDRTMFRFENAGLNQILLYQITSEQHLDITPAFQQNNPLLLSRGEIKEVTVAFQTPPELEQRWNFHLFSSAGETNYPYLVASIPEITFSLGSGEEKITLSGGENIYFYAPGELDIPCEISIDNHSVVLFNVELVNPTGHIRRSQKTSLPHLLIPEEPFMFQLSLPDTEGEEFTCQFELNFQLLGPKAFSITFQEHIPPKLVHTRSAYFTGEDAIHSTAKQPREFHFTFGNQGGEVLRVNSVEATADWIQIPNTRQLLGQMIHPGIAEQSEEALKLDISILPERIPFPANFDESEADDNHSENDVPTQPEPIPQHFQVSGEKLVIIYTDLATSRSFTEEIPIEIEVRQPEPLRIPLAIDFGTTNTAVAYVPNRSTTPKTVTLDWEADIPDQISSCLRFVHYHKSDVLLHTVNTGRRVYDGRFGSLEAIKSTAWGWKRFLGKGEDFKLSYIDERGTVKMFTPVDLTTLFLKKVIEAFEDARPYKVQSLLLTFPEAFGKAQKDQLIEAVRRIGYSEKNVKLIISEPQALAFEYVYHEELEVFELEENDERYFAVFDFGGGTTDITVARVRYSEETDDKIIETLRTHGNSRLGGDYLTFLIAQKLYEIFMSSEFAGGEEGAQVEIPFPKSFEAMMSTTSTDDELSNYGILEYEAERLKIFRYSELPEEGETNTSSDVGGFLRSSDGDEKNFAVSFSMEDFKEAVEQVIRDGFDILNSIVMALYEDEELRKDEANLDVLILAGNSSKLQLVREIAEEEALADIVEFKPETCKIGVPIGALIAYEYEIGGGENRVLFPIGYSRRGRFEVLFGRNTQINPQDPPRRQIEFPRVYRRDYFPIYVNKDPEFREHEPDDTPESKRRRQIMGNEHIEEIAPIPIPLGEVQGQQTKLEIGLLEKHLEYSILVSEDGENWNYIIQGEQIPISISWLGNI